MLLHRCDAIPARRIDHRRVDEPPALHPHSGKLGIHQDATIRGELLPPEIPAVKPPEGARGRRPARGCLPKVVPPLVVLEREVDDQDAAWPMIEGRHLEREIANEQIELRAEIGVLSDGRLVAGQRVLGRRACPASALASRGIRRNSTRERLRSRNSAMYPFNRSSNCWRTVMSCSRDRASAAAPRYQWLPPTVLPQLYSKTPIVMI